MAVHIRLSRLGAKKHPFYRIVVADHRSPRGGRFLENIGSYDPSGEKGTLIVDTARLSYWRSKGALASATLDRLLKRQAREAPTAGEAVSDAPLPRAPASSRAASGEG